MNGPTLSLETGEGANAADPNAILAALSGRGVVTGGEVHAASEPFALQVMSTDGWFADPKADLEASITDGNVAIGSHVQPQSATFSVRELGDDTYPRKILVCVARDGDGNRAGGDYHVVAGEPAQARPQDFTEVKNTSEPGLPDLVDRPDLLPLAGCWIGGTLTT